MSHIWNSSINKYGYIFIRYRYVYVAYENILESLSRELIVLREWRKEMT